MTTLYANHWVSDAKAISWLPLIVLPGAVLLLGSALPAWVWMWLLAGSLFVGLKWLTFADTPQALAAPWPRAAGYLFLWPGMDARAFCGRSRDVQKPRRLEWVSVAACMATGAILATIVAPRAIERHPMIAGWVAMTGIVLMLHFGAIQLLSILWRRAGVDAQPIMHAPLRARSLADFWGRRWNLAFRDLTFRYVVRPVAPRLGVTAATLIAFLVSGLIHDVVISIPARGGYGLPTLYFLIHGCGLIAERNPIGRRIGLGHGIRGRIFAAAVTIVPLPLAFPRPFVERIIVPMLDAVNLF